MLVALLMISKPLHDLLPELFVGPDLVHGERTAVEWVCLVTVVKKQKDKINTGLRLYQLEVVFVSKQLKVVFSIAEIKC